MNRTLKIENSKESARKAKGSKKDTAASYTKKVSNVTPEHVGFSAKAKKTYEYASYGEWAILFFGLCFCFLILLTSSDTIRRISESEGVGTISSSLGNLISQHDSIAVFFGLDNNESDKEASTEAEEMTIPTFSYTSEQSAKDYVDKHNADNYQRSGVSPTSVGVISSDYSFRKNPFYLVYDNEDEYEFHSGIDIAADEGTEIRSYLDGTVEKCALSAAYGYYVSIDHGDGLKTLYAHASKLLCKEGDKVKKGDTIALVGSTGRSTGPHVHFEVYKDGQTQNPKDYLPSTFRG